MSNVENIRPLAGIQSQRFTAKTDYPSGIFETLKVEPKRSLEAAVKPVLSSFARILLLAGLLSSFTSLQAASTESSNRLQRIHNTGELRVCIWPEYFSISARHPKTGLLEGIDIELSHEFASDLGVSVKYVETHFGRFIQDLKEDQCDIAMFGVAITEQRQRQIDYSEPYLASQIYAVTTRTHAAINEWKDIDQHGVIVSVQEGTYMQGYMQRAMTQADMLVVRDPRERELKVMSGQADVFLTDYPYSRKVLRFYDWARVITPASEGGHPPFRYAYAIAPEQPEWLAQINAFVKHIKQDGRLKQAAERYDLLPAIMGSQDN